MKTPIQPLAQPRGLRGFTLVELLVVISIIVVLAGIATPAAMRGLKHAERVEGLSNVRNIKGALDLFAADFEGEYPSDSTAILLEELLRDDEPRSSSRKLEGKWKLDSKKLAGSGSRQREQQRTSNDYFNQLMSRGLDNEELLYNSAFRRSFDLQRPNKDGKVDRGENVWGYTANLMNTSASHLPLVFDTPISTGDSPRFSKKTWDGRILVARLDGSTATIPIGGSNPDAGPVRDTINGRSTNIFSPEALEEGRLAPADLKARGSD
ncbi:type II secretion system protein [Roseibacillus persicicus]|uniref:type II secretion system protein n=1 Tax=Roseibacillus persicicus TaxID=454148 RepID=UPI00280D7FFE|nr:prepilin-type N-terminal cleavage/methylation domain-containing protein [Roseibacillus persicicus]MDQ8191448.1 prepilin-type N-terminal cleavage/methylation domain-containing protein [Roseibacillus persicicus]